MNVSLVMFKSDGTRRDFPMSKDRVVVGRKNDCDLRIPLSSVSRQHCEIRVSGSQVKIRDLGSSNGTYHNNIRIQEAMLAAGDEISIGPVVFTVMINGQPEQIEPVHSIVAHEVNGTAVSLGRPEEFQDRLHTTDAGLTPAAADEVQAPTLDLDDPIAALERLAASEQNEDSADELQFLRDDDDRLA